MFQAVEISHVLEGLLKHVVQEAKVEKALKQVAESNIEEKNQVMAEGEMRAIATEKDKDSYQHKVSVLEGKLEDSDTQLAQALSVISSRDKELESLKADLEEAEQKYYCERPKNLVLLEKGV